MLYLWEPAHTARARVTKQSPHSLIALSPLPQSKEWHLLVIRGATWSYQPALHCDNPPSSIKTRLQELWPVTFNMQMSLKCVRTNICRVILASTVPSCFPLWIPNVKSWRSPVAQWGNSTALGYPDNIRWIFVHFLAWQQTQRNGNISCCTAGFRRSLKIESMLEIQVFVLNWHFSNAGSWPLTVLPNKERKSFLCLCSCFSFNSISPLQ